METRLNSPRLDPFDKWVAQWNDVLEYDKPYGMWQYTNNGILNGRQFDMDYAYKDYPEIIKGMGGDDMTKEEVLKLAQQVYDENEKRYPTIDSVPNWAREGGKAGLRGAESGRQRHSTPGRLSWTQATAMCGQST